MIPDAQQLRHVRDGQFEFCPLTFIFGEAAGAIMELEKGTLRALHLAGTVALPLSYSTTGHIWFEKRELRYRSSTRKVDLIFVREKDPDNQESTRFVVNEDVEAIFFPGAKEGRNGNSSFHFADYASDLDTGYWFLGPDVNADAIKEELNIDIYQRDSGAKGIIFVPEIKSVYSKDEWAETAGDAYFTCGCDPRRPRP